MNLNLAQLGLFHASSGSPFGLNNGAWQLRGRYFIADDMAIRVGLNITSQSTKNRFAENADGTGSEGTQKLGYSMIGIRPGFEKHFKGSDKLSTYAGVDLIINLTNATEKWESYDGTTYNKDYTAEIKGAWADGSKKGGTGIGLNLVAGADWYFMPNVYLGAEFGWGFVATSTKKVETKITNAGTSTTTTTPKGSGFDLSPNIVGGIRLGFKF